MYHFPFVHYLISEVEITLVLVRTENKQDKENVILFVVKFVKIDFV